MTIEFERPERDPLLAALIEKLPAPGSTWSHEDRQAWLELMRKAFDLVYGRAGLAPATVAESGAPVGGGMSDAVVMTPRARRPAAAARDLESDESSVAA